MTIRSRRCTHTTDKCDKCGGTHMLSELLSDVENDGCCALGRDARQSTAARIASSNTLMYCCSVSTEQSTADWSPLTATDGRHFQHLSLGAAVDRVFILIILAVYLPPGYKRSRLRHNYLHLLVTKTSARLHRPTKKESEVHHPMVNPGHYPIDQFHYVQFIYIL